MKHLKLRWFSHNRYLILMVKNMDMSKTKEVISLIANVGVIGSIVFLGIEMQQNTDMMQSQTRNSIVENQLSFYESIVENADFAEISSDFRADPNAYLLGSSERFRYVFYVMSQFRMWENEWYQFKKGLFDANEFDSRVVTWKRNINVEIRKEIWFTQRESYSKDFSDYLNSIIEEPTL